MENNFNGILNSINSNTCIAKNDFRQLVDKKIAPILMIGASNKI